MPHCQITVTWYAQDVQELKKDMPESYKSTRTDDVFDIFFQVIVIAEQIRSEPNNTGLHREVIYWKKRMAKFCSLTEQLKTPQVRHVLCILHAAKSRLVEVC